MSDIVERLRRRIGQADVMEKYLMIESVAEIERLQTQCAALEHYGAVMRAATIEECALMAEHYKFDPLEYYNNGLAKKYIAAAIRALLKEQK